MTAAIDTQAIGHQFGKHRVLEDITFTVAEGSVYALIGSNGTGKSTTLKILLNILRPTRGRATVLGTDSRALGPAEFRGIGYVADNQDLPEWMTVAQLMAYLRPFYPAWDNDREAELLRQFELPVDRKIQHLSRGMRMKASLAASLAYRPQLLLLDEPFSGLDPLVRDEVVDSLLDCVEHTTLVISSHDLAEVEGFATHVGYLDAGRLQFSEPMTSLSDRFREVEITLGPHRTLPPAWPEAWLQPEAAAGLVRFVHPQFNHASVAAETVALFGQDARLDAHPMSLRSIFTTLARVSRRPA